MKKNEMNFINDPESQEDYELYGIHYNIIYINKKLIRLPFTKECLVLNHKEEDKDSIKYFFYVNYDFLNKKEEEYNI